MSTDLDLPTNLQRLAAAMASVVAAGRCEAEAASVADLAERIATRRRLAPTSLVVALAGTTGAGKSSLFNALCEADLAQVGALRPTTSEPRAAVFGPPVEGTGALLDWLGLRERHFLTSTGPDLDSLILVDLPDIDSLATENRERADALIDTVDVLVWVVDPEKYGDARLHRDYLQPLHNHGVVMDVVLNQIDRLDPSERTEARTDLHRLLRAGGTDAGVFLTSVTQDLGLREVRERLVERVEAKQDQEQRLALDAGNLARHLSHHHPLTPADCTRVEQHLHEFTDEVLSHIGVPTYCQGLTGQYRDTLRRHTTSPLFAWARKTRPVPPRTSLRTTFLATPVAHLAAAFTGVGAWWTLLRETVDPLAADLATRLGAYRPEAVRPDLPRWAAWARRGHWAALIVLILAVLTFGIEMGVRYFGMSLPPALGAVGAEPGYPALPAVSWSVALAVIGVVCAVAVGVVVRAARAVAVRRYRTRLTRRIGGEVRSLVDDRLAHHFGELLGAARTYATTLADVERTVGARRS